jgi:signal transduction histidine kinase
MRRRWGDRGRGKLVRLTAGLQNCAGIALTCDNGGRILETLSDQLGVAGCFPAGRLFTSCLAPGSLAKGLSFLQEIHTREAAYGWELEVAAEDGRVRTICFDGCQADGQLLVLGAGSSEDLLGFLDDLMRINNEQVTRVRGALKEMSLKGIPAGRPEHELYNELTRVNNQLANAQRELTKQNCELERLNRLKTQFLGMAAHDLRSPIGHILSYSDFLREEAAQALTEEQLEFLAVIQRSSEFMLQVIDDFLDVSAIESGNLHLDCRRADPRKLLESNIAMNAMLAQKKKIRLRLEADGELPEVSFDEKKITQVLNNLISNAVKFAQPGTEVTVRAVAEAGAVRISVADQGPGIPESERGKLFQPFGKTSVRSTAGESSTGLGLAIVRKIIEGHGGRLWLESEVGAGSVFFFTLPA